MAATKMSIKRAAEILGVSRNKITRLEKEGAVKLTRSPLDKREYLIAVDEVRRIADEAGIEVNI